MINTITANEIKTKGVSALKKQQAIIMKHLFPFVVRINM